MKQYNGASGWTVAATALYVLWGVLHLGLGVSMVLGGISAEASAGEAQAESLMFFLCAALLGGQAIAVALTMNRLNSRRGHWLNLLTLGIVDAAFLMVMVLPGHVDVIGGVSGPAIWVLAAIASTVALRRAPATA
ncbi:hypothetical protein AB0L25_15560 [Spirillospora sp. NPDC052242]